MQSKGRMTETDQAALDRALAGEPDGFRVLVERYSHALFRLAFRMTGNESDAEDIVQESFLRAWKNLSKYDGRASFSTWLYRIAANCALDHLRGRRRKRNEPLDELAPVESLEPGPDRLAFGGQVSARIESALAQLSAQERTAFVLRHHEELSIDEISSALGVSREATKNSVFRAVQKLRRALAPVAGTA